MKRCFKVFLRGLLKAGMIYCRDELAAGTPVEHPEAGWRQGEASGWVLRENGGVSCL